MMEEEKKSTVSSEAEASVAAEKSVEEEKKSEGAGNETPSGEETVSSEEANKADEPKATEETKAAEEPQATAATPAVEPDWKDRYARLLADFDNFKKRTARDREDTYRFAEADILKDVLPTVDNLALALANAKDEENDFVKGVRLVYETLLKALKDHQAEPFDSVGQALDTERMEAIATLPSADIEEGKVSNEVKRGWLLKGKVLRAAQVVVSSGAPAEAK